MKRRITTIAVSVSLFNIGLLGIANADDTSLVTQIVLLPNPHTIAIEIDLPRIDNIFTAGHYAWAVDLKDAMVAFYNGNVWGEGQHIPGMTSLSAFYPAYPVSGAKPSAWAFGTNNSDMLPSEKSK